MRHHLGVGEQKGVDGFAKAGVFDANAGGGGEQQPGQQVEGVLRAQGNENFVRGGDNAALGQHPGADLLDEHRHILVNMVDDPRRVAHPAVQPVRRRAPGGQRELPGIGLAVDKRVAVVHPARRFEDRLLLAGGHLQPVAPAWCSRFALRCTLDGGRRSFMIVGMQVVTAAWAANQVALVDQTFKHQRGGVARDAKLAGQLATGGQWGVGGEDPAENGIHQRLSHLFLQTAARLKINV